MTDTTLNERQAIGRVELVCLIAFMMALNAAAIDVFIPALSDIGTALGESDPARQSWIILIYVMGFGAGQVFYGPLSDALGRRSILFVGLAIYIVAALAGAFASSFGFLLVCRFLQGLGTAATRVIATSVVRDLYSGRTMAATMSIVFMVFMVVPVIAPNIGALILIFGTWQELSLIVAAFGIAMAVWSWLRLPETLPVERRRPLSTHGLLNSFAIVFHNPVARLYALANALVFGVLFALVGQAEQIYAGIYALGDGFTVYFSMAAIAIAASSFANSRLVERFGMERMSRFALLVFVAFSALHLVIATFHGGNAPFWVFQSLLMGTLCMFGFIGANLNALAMEPLGAVAGTGSSVLGSAQSLGGALFAAVITYFFDGTVIPLLIGFTVLGALALLVSEWAKSITARS